MRTIHDIIPPSGRRDNEPLTSNEPTRPEPYRAPERSSQFPYKTLGVVIIIIALSLGALYYFSSAEVSITPNTVSAAVQNSFTATAGTGDLPYQIITAQKIATQSVQGNGTKTVNTLSSGTITIYNTQSKVQRLITNTRFATTDGLIFHIHQPVSIPAGTAASPGTIKATIYADKAGDTYNVGPTSFTVPGFAGTPQATEVYGRSEVALTGGASGSIPVVESAVEQQTQNALTGALAPELTASLQSQIPAGYTLLPGAATTTFTELTPTPSATTGMVDVKEQGTITAVIFPNAALAKQIATSIAGLDYQGEPLSLLPVSSLQLSSVGLPDAQATSFSFTLAGTASLVYTVDPTRIAAAVAGKSRVAAEAALTNYPEVKSTILILRPFWRQTFPDDPSTITITVTNP
jgi:hypothetical protein